MNALQLAMRQRGPAAGPSRRAISDLIVKPQTGQPIIRYGTGGRSSVSGHTATVFGASGFLGRYVVSKLAKSGTQVIVPFRGDGYDSRYLRVMGDLGQIVPMEWDMKRPDQIAECLRHSDVVYNCTGREWETRNYSFDDVHATGAGLIAQIAKDHDVARFIHVSHLNADAKSTSSLYRSKAKGERLVRKHFPEATIVRPGPIFGWEDHLLIYAARFPFLFAQNGGQTKMRPVHFSDVAQALRNLMDSEVTSEGATLSLPGPEAFTHAEFMSLVRSFTLRPQSMLETGVPKPLLSAFAALTNKFIWWPTMDRDRVERMYIDDKSDSAIRKGRDSMTPAQSWEAVGVSPDKLEDHAIKYLKMFRSPENMTAPSYSATLYKPKQYKSAQIITRSRD